MEVSMVRCTREEVHEALDHGRKQPHLDLDAQGKYKHAKPP